MSDQRARTAFQTRRMTFSAAHKLYSNDLTEEANELLYGKCVTTHGHNYIVEITLLGPVDPTTGMIMNMTELKRYMEITIMEKLDHKNIDEHIVYFHDHPSTTENLAIYIWESIYAVLPNPDLLYEVKLYETENNFVVYRGA